MLSRQLLICLTFPLLALAGCRKGQPAGGADPSANDASASPTVPLGIQPKPIPAITHAIVISIDGCRPDLIFRADAKNLIILTRRGSFSLWAKTSDIPVTLPSHTSMMTGFSPGKHQVTFNGYEPGKYPAVPTLFEVAHANGLSTALVASKMKFHSLARPGSVDWLWIKDVDSAAVADEATRVILTARPNMMLVHFRENDLAGHAYGWGSPAQLAALGRIDLAVGQILAAVEQAGLAGSTMILISADHGGTMTGHGADTAGATIPWIVQGPGIHQNFDLTRSRGSMIRTEDTFATVSWILGLPIASDVEGKPVTEIVDKTGEELLHDVPATAASTTRASTMPATYPTDN